MNSLKITVIIPAYNESLSITETINDFKSLNPRPIIVVVDNNSTDETAIMASYSTDPSVDFIISETSQGKGYALKRGLSRIESDIFVIVDADNTYRASDAQKMIDLLIATRADMIVGDRVSRGDYDVQNTRFGHGLGNIILTRLVSALAGQKYNDVLSGLRVMSKPFVDMVAIRSSGFQVETEISISAAYIRADVLEIPIMYYPRPEGSFSKLNTINDGFRIIKFAFLNWIGFSPLGFFIAFFIMNWFIAMIFGFRVVSGFIETGWPYTTTAVAAAVCLILGALSIFSGVILRIIVGNDRRREIAAFQILKRKWNEKIDKFIL